MASQKKYRLVGKYENGERVVLTKQTTREIAEKIITLMTPGCVFADLVIEDDKAGDAE
jgi:hypothetical protein